MVNKPLSREEFEATGAARQLGPALRFIRSLTLGVPTVVPGDVIEHYKNWRQQLASTAARELDGGPTRLSIRTTEDGVTHACLVERLALDERRSTP